MRKENAARAKFRARSKQEAATRARLIVARLIQNYFDTGQPHDEANESDVPVADADRLRDALDVIRVRMAR